MLPCTSAMTRSPVAGSSAGAANRGAPELCVHAMLRLTAGTLLLCPLQRPGAYACKHPDLDDNTMRKTLLCISTLSHVHQVQFEYKYGLGLYRALDATCLHKENTVQQGGQALS